MRGRFRINSTRQAAPDTMEMITDQKTSGCLHGTDAAPAGMPGHQGAPGPMAWLQRRFPIPGRRARRMLVEAALSAVSGRRLAA